MSYGIIVDGVDPTEAFDCLITNRNVTPPARKNILETIPFKDGGYDFSALGGEPCFELRVITYQFTVTDTDPEKVRKNTAALEDWLYGIHEKEIHDALDNDWHFEGSVTDVTTDWSFKARTAIVTATITCHPFRIANEERQVTLQTGEGTVNNAGRRTTFHASTTGSTTLTIGNMSQSFSGDVLLDLYLASGDNAVLVEGSPCTLKWKEVRI